MELEPCELSPLGDLPSPDTCWQVNARFWQVDIEFFGENGLDQTMPDRLCSRSGQPNGETQ